MDQKPFWASLTFWGAVVAVAAPVLTSLGVEIPGGGEGLAEEIVTIIGGIMAVIGRFKAETKLTLT